MIAPCELFDGRSALSSSSSCSVLKGSGGICTVLGMGQGKCSASHDTGKCSVIDPAGGAPTGPVGGLCAG